MSLQNFDSAQKAALFGNGVKLLADGVASPADIEYLGFYAEADGTVTFSPLESTGDANTTTPVTNLIVYGGTYFICPMKNVTPTGTRLILGYAG